MRSDSFHRSGGNYFSVLTDVEVIACSVESPPPVAFFQVVLREAAVFSRGGAVNHDQIDFSHSSGSIFRCSPRGETSGTPGCIPVFSVISSSFFAVLSFVVSRFCHRGHRVTRSFVEKVYPIKIYILCETLCYPVVRIYAVGSSTISPPPLPPPSGAPADTNAKFTLFGLRVMLRLAFTSFIALSGMKRTFNLLIFFTVHSFSVSPGRQVSVMWKVPSPSIFTLFPWVSTLRNCSTNASMVCFTSPVVRAQLVWMSSASASISTTLAVPAFWRI